MSLVYHHIDGFFSMLSFVLGEFEGKVFYRNEEETSVKKEA